MSESICYKCNEFISSGNVHIIALKHNKESHELAAHKLCADDIENKLKDMKNLNKLSIKEVLDKLNV